MSNRSESDTTIYYFGCWNAPGHYLFIPDGAKPRGIEPEWYVMGDERRNIDGTLAPRRFRHTKVVTFYGEHPMDAQQRIEGKTVECPQGQYLIHVLDNGYTAMQWWDRTQGDTRGACNSTILLEGKRTEEELLAALRERFPHVEKNLRAAGIELVDVTDQL